MGYVKTLKEQELVGGTSNTEIYPITTTGAIYSFYEYEEGGQIKKGVRMYNGKPETLELRLADLEHQMDTLSITGVALSNTSGNGTHISMTQKAITDRFYELYDTLGLAGDYNTSERSASRLAELERDNEDLKEKMQILLGYNTTVSLTSSLYQVEADGQNHTITLTASCVPVKTDITYNDVTVRNVDTAVFQDTVNFSNPDDRRIFTVNFANKGNRSVTVSAIKHNYLSYGASVPEDFESIEWATEEITNSPVGTLDSMEVTDGSKIYIKVPNSIQFETNAVNGDVITQGYQLWTVGGVSFQVYLKESNILAEDGYHIYMSSSTWNAGTYRFKVVANS